MDDLNPRIMKIWSLIQIITNNYEPNIEEYYGNTYFNSISFTLDNKKLLFTLVGRNEIFIWDVETNSLSDKIFGPESGIRKLELSKDGKKVAFVCVLSSA